MCSDFIFDKFFMNSSIYFVAPSEHVDLRLKLCELIQRINIKCISVLIQQDSQDGFILPFVSVYSIGEFHKWLYCIVNNMRCKFGLSYNQFHYL